MNTPKDTQPLTTFRDSKWRYSQFVVLGLLVTLLVKWLSSLSWLPSLVIGGVTGLAYFLLEKKRGVI